MRVIAATQTTDFRLQACKHDRLREALEFRPRHLSALPAAPAAPAAPVEAVVKPAAPAKGKSLLGGAVAMLGLAASWFVFASVASVDFSAYDTDSSTPQIIRPTTTVSAAPSFAS